MTSDEGIKARIFKWVRRIGSPKSTEIQTCWFLEENYFFSNTGAVYDFSPQRCEQALCFSHGDQSHWQLHAGCANEVHRAHNFCIKNPHNKINEMSCYAALCHVMSCDVTLHYVRSQSSCVLVIQSLRLKHSPPSSQGRWSSMGDIWRTQNVVKILKYFSK